MQQNISRELISGRDYVRFDLAILWFACLRFSTAGHCFRALQFPFLSTAKSHYLSSLVKLKNSPYTREH